LAVVHFVLTQTAMPAVHFLWWQRHSDPDQYPGRFEAVVNPAHAIISNMSPD